MTQMLMTGVDDSVAAPDQVQPGARVMPDPLEVAPPDHVRQDALLRKWQTRRRLGASYKIQLAIKRCIDVVGAVLLLIITFPILCAVAVGVKLDSPGPVLFRQRRLGLNGRVFTLYKFRSMRADAEQLLRENAYLYGLYVQNGYKLPREIDPRISRFGSFLRQTSLDELPQLFNVIRGDMSLVGPRPIVEEEIREYGDRASLFLSAKPGLTGYWQVSGRSNVGYPERVDIELEYVVRWSLWLDLMILLKTPFAVLRRDGAY